MADSSLDGVSTNIEKLMTFSQTMLPEHPKRPLSSYNIFFREARRKILNDLPDTRKRSKKTCYYSNRAPHGKIGFADLARTISGMWKSISPEEQKVYDEKAREDRMRYDKEMAEWKSIMEEEKEKLQTAEKIGKVRSITMRIDEEQSPSTHEKGPGIFIQPVSCVEYLHKSQFLNDMAGSIVEAAVQVLQSNHEIEKLASILVFLGNACSTLTKEKPTNLSGKAATEKPLIEMKEPASAMMTNGTMRNDCMGILRALLAHASLENRNVDVHKDHDSDPFSPTISHDYMSHYSWLASKMGQENTALLIDIFEN